MKIKTVLLSLSALCALTSCIDDKYDLDNADYKLGFGSQDNVIWLPKSSTGQAVFKNLFPLNNTESTQILKCEKDANGREFYCLETNTNNLLRISMSPVDTVIVEGDKDINVDLSNRPKFLDHPQTNLDFICPRFLVTLTNESDIDIETGICLTPSEGHVAQTEGGAFKSPRQSVKRYYVSEEPNADGLPAEFAEAEWVKLDGLHDLIAKVPHSISANLIQFKSVSHGATGEGILNVDYQFYCPVDVGANFSVINSDSTYDWHNSLKDVKVDCRQLIAKAKVKGSIPMQIQATVEPIDLEGKLLEGLTVSTDSVVVNNTLKVNGDEESEIALYLTPKEGYKLIDLMTGEGTNVLDGIRFEYGTMTKADGSSTGKRIYNDMYIELKDILFGLKGTIIYDAN